MEKIIRCYKPEGKVEDITSTIPFGELQKKVGGYVEIHTVGGITIACDEDGKLKRLPFCRNFGDSCFVGNVYVGKFTGAGLVPVPVNEIVKFEQTFMSIE